MTAYPVSIPKDQQTSVTTPVTGFLRDHLHNHVLLDQIKNDRIWLLKFLEMLKHYRDSNHSTIDKLHLKQSHFAAFPTAKISCDFSIATLFSAGVFSSKTSEFLLRQGHNCRYCCQVKLLQSSGLYNFWEALEIICFLSAGD